MKNIKSISTICFVVFLVGGCNATDNKENDVKYIATATQNNIDTEVATKTENGLILIDGKEVLPRKEPMEKKNITQLSMKMKLYK